MPHKYLYTGCDYRLICLCNKFSSGFVIIGQIVCIVCIVYPVGICHACVICKVQLPLYHPYFRWRRALRIIYIQMCELASHSNSEKDDSFCPCAYFITSRPPKRRELRYSGEIFRENKMLWPLECIKRLKDISAANRTGGGTI